MLGRDYGHVLRKALEFEGQEEARTTKEDVGDASGEEQECWFGEKGCHELSKMESGNWSNC